ncbi:MAG TPA: sigma-70 family RNA polymerase sigma factor, partial [Marmoricola sp.]|nr:sigma-70 family RNA polymerase sigma factor [Marmoricola sp.]
MGEKTTGNTASTAPNDQFEALYLALRRRLLLQCFALTGDLSASRSGVREAFISARQQWRRVGALEHPETWIRQRAMNTAQHRHVPHRRRAHHGLDEHQITVVTTLAEMKDGERKALILHYLGDLDALAIGRDLAITERNAQQRLANAEATFASKRACDRADIAEELRSLAPIVTHPGLPRAHAIHDRAHRRARLQIVVGVAMAAALATLGGLLIRPTSHSDALALINARPVTHAMFLSSAQVNAALPGSTWHETGTSTITPKSGPRDACQRSPLADNNAVGAWVRQFQSSTGSTLTQRTEISTDATSYGTTLAWYANCSDTAAQLVSAAALKGVGKQGWLFQINVAKPATTYQVMVAQQGLITSTLVLSGSAGAIRSATPSGLAELGRVMTQGLCQASAAETCVPVKNAEAVTAVPPIVEYKGMLIASDLPLLAGMEQPWVGIKPTSGGTNLAATLCDSTTFTGATTKARNFLIPGAQVPATFGITETLATYPT